MPLVTDDRYTIHVPNAARIWRVIDRNALHGFDRAGHLYVWCSLATAQAIARQVAADRLQRNGWPSTGEGNRKRYTIDYLACDHCQNTGTYRWGPSINGKPPLHSAPCYRCDGKGYQDDNDQRRNYGYDNHRKVFA